jgi:hypothetical protein
MRLLAWLTPPLLAAYAFFDRGFAWVHIPGTPIFAGEALMAVVIAAAFFATGYIRAGLRHNLAGGLLVLFATWGMVRTAPLLQTYGQDAIRDSALWYYALIAVAVAGLVVARPQLPERWAATYARFLPWFLVWSPVAILVSSQEWPAVPGSDVPFLSHKVGNIAVHATMGLAFLWLVPGVVRHNRRVVLTALGTVVILMVATQNRAGFLAALAGLGLAALLNVGRGGRLLGTFVAATAFAVVLAWGLDVRVAGPDRTYSVSQLFENVSSIGGAQASGNLNGTVEWRNDLWSTAINATVDNHRLLTGWGFGPNLFEELGFQGEGSNPLRSPHNSHLDVFGRMGLVGAAIWIALWASWYTLLLRSRRPLRALGHVRRVALIDVVLVGVTATLVNAYFDPALESPPVALWTWALFGLGVGLARMRAHPAPAPAAEAP